MKFRGYFGGNLTEGAKFGAKRGTRLSDRAPNKAQRGNLGEFCFPSTQQKEPKKVKLGQITWSEVAHGRHFPGDGVNSCPKKKGEEHWDMGRKAKPRWSNHREEVPVVF